MGGGGVVFGGTVVNVGRGGGTGTGAGESEIVGVGGGMDVGLTGVVIGVVAEI